MNGWIFFDTKILNGFAFNTQTVPGLTQGYTIYSSITTVIVTKLNCCGRKLVLT